MQESNETIQGVKGLNLFYNQLIPVHPLAWVIIVHGLGEHSGRYAHVVARLTASGYAVAMYDHRGHGKSDGMRTYVDRFQDYVDDLAIVYRHVEQIAEARPVFLLAQSMGCLVACQFCMLHQPALQGVILSAAALKVSNDFPPLLQKLSGMLSAVIPKLASLKIDNKKLSRDPQVFDTVLKDPLHYKGGIRVRTGAEILAATEWIDMHWSEFKLPVLLLHGSADQIASHEGSIDFYKRCSSSDKEYKEYPGAYHELMNEINKEDVFSDILKWLREHV